MNRKQKIKKYFKENWLLYFFLVLAIVFGVLGGLASNNKHNNKMVESEINRAKPVLINKRHNLLNVTQFQNVLRQYGLFDITLNFNNIEVDADDYVEFFNENDKTYLSKSVVYDMLDADGIQDITNLSLHIRASDIDNALTTTLVDFAFSGVIDLSLYYNGSLVKNWDLSSVQDQTISLSYLAFIDNGAIYTFDQIWLTYSNLASPSSFLRVFSTQTSLGYTEGYNSRNDEVNELVFQNTQKTLTINELQQTIAQLSEGDNFGSIVTHTIETPFNAIRNMLNFEILGVNLFGLFSFICTLCLVLFIFKKLR